MVRFLLIDKKMLNKNLKLNNNLFDSNVGKIPTRKGFGEGLLIAGKNDSRIIALSADLSDSTQVTLFKESFPNRYIEVGVAEQNLASVASGLSASGKVPVIASYAIFSPGRNWEQIRTTICYNDRKVVIAGSHAGLSVGPDGGSHQALEDIALTRVMPNMTVISPCDALEAKKAIIASLNDSQISPVYLRLARDKSPLITTEDTPFEIGKAQIVWGDNCDSSIGHSLCDVGIIATGPILFNVLLAAKKLDELKIKVKVLNLSTIKPLDEDAIITIARQSHGKILTVEEHQVSGGMGSAIAELLSRKHPSKISFVGVNNRFGQSGTTEELYKEYGLTVDDIVEKVKELI